MGETPTPWRLCEHNGGDWFDVEPADGGGWFLRLSPGYPFGEFPDPAEVEANFNANAALIVKAVNGRATLLAALANIVANAVMQPDASMAGATDCYAVPLDDIEAARRALEES